MKAFARYGVLIAAALLAACSATPGDKYPFAPQFVSPLEVPPTTLKAPPRPGSKTYAKELNMVINTQKYLTPEDKRQAMHESGVWIEMLTDPVLGEGFNAARYPETFTLLRRAGSDAWRIGDTTKDYWKSTRPWLADNRVQLFVEPIHSYSYPSGHTLTNHVWARILGDLMPEHRVALIQQADAVANNRVKGGVHYYFDLHAGIRLADVMYCQMKKSPEFRDAFRRARAEVLRINPNLPIGYWRNAS